MKKQIWKHLAYYCSIPIVYFSVLWLISAIINTDNFKNDLGVAIVATYGVVFVVTPIVTFLLMRFSMLKWAVDPFAAAELPAALYCMMLINRCERVGTFSKAFAGLNASLAADGGEGFIYLSLLFVFGLICSVSFKRAKGEFFIGRLKEMLR